MAWLSQGTSNEALIDAMVSHEVIKAGTDIDKSFRCTDRSTFIRQSTPANTQIFNDRPYKDDLVHMSAPHMYVQIITAMEFSDGQSFLNVGSGSGYLSCLVSCLIGEGGVSHGIEINADLVKLSTASCKFWFDSILNRRRQGELNLPKVTREGVSFVQGNCFDIDVRAAKSVCLYDRIYIGAGCPEKNLKFFLSLLADDGMLIAPIQERGELVRIRKIIGGCFETKRLSHVYYAPLVQVPRRRTRSDLDVDASDSDDETSVDASDFDVHDVIDNQESIAGTEQAGEDGNTVFLSTSMHQQTPARELVRLPTLTWRPTYSRHRQFPESFRSVVFGIYVALRFPNRGVAAQPFYRLHNHLWTLIFSYASRSWFIPTPSQVDSLLAEVSVERKLRAVAEKSLREVQRERDILKVMVIRLQRSLNSSFAHSNTHEAEEEQSDMEDEDDSVQMSENGTESSAEDGLAFEEDGSAVQIDEAAEEEELQNEPGTDSLHTGVRETALGEEDDAVADEDAGNMLDSQREADDDIEE